MTAFEKKYCKFFRRQSTGTGMISAECSHIIRIQAIGHESYQLARHISRFYAAETILIPDQSWRVWEKSDAWQGGWYCMGTAWCTVTSDGGSVPDCHRLWLSQVLAASEKGSFIGATPQYKGQCADPAAKNRFASLVAHKTIMVIK